MYDVLLTCVSVHPMCAWPPHVCLMTREARQGCQIPLDCSYRWLLSAMWGLGVEPRSPGGAASALNH